MEGAAPAGGEIYEAEFTWVAFFCCLTAASGGALFGYDNGAHSIPVIVPRVSSPTPGLLKSLPDCDRSGVFSACLCAAVSCAACTGVMGGVTSMNGFLNDYFPSVAANQAAVNTVGNLYCQYDSATLQLMTSSLFIAGACTELSGTTGTVINNARRHAS